MTSEGPREGERPCEWCGTPYPDSDLYVVSTRWGDLLLCGTCRPHHVSAEEARRAVEEFTGP